MSSTIPTMADLKWVLEYLLSPSKPVIVYGILIVLLLPLVLHYLVTRTTPYTNLPTILLAGPSAGGKTALLTLLERGEKATETHTSQTLHAIELTVSSDPGASTFREAARDDAPGSHKKFHLIDTPGHGKLRGAAMAQLGGDEKGSQTAPFSDPATLRGVIFMVDAATLTDSLVDTTTYLYDVLLALQKRACSGSSSRPPHPINVLVAANKLDLFTALPASLVRGSLEAELGRIRLSRSIGLLSLGIGEEDVGTDDPDNWLGQYGSDKFIFEQMREFDIEVDVIGGSVLEGKVDKWWDWISSRI
ncbi:signal recognition particle receptor beta subunit-domain-containing protein [Xylaria nigripes]|nr:signal recognition particle receptor beta subunit-domain-containing protein [Xylaria nigripes]